ncbi:MAG TPA: acetate/propionate family kinase [Solirubrobacteraceae bacterium]|nr:acetate/propionate family kinase [Solirubrobacteraceae bacterium]
MARVLVVNAGSSTVKLSLIGTAEEALWDRELAAPSAQVDREQLRDAIEEIAGEVEVVGHRIVHGGNLFRSAVRIDQEVEEQLRQLGDLAPLHQAKSLAALDAVSTALPGIPSFACFDTAFHATLAPEARTYALPEAWRTRWPIRRYGFHGLSHGWVARRAPELLGGDANSRRIISCHLGAGASLCAIQGGRSVATTMGFTPLEGLVMATRSGDVDPGLLLWLLERGEIDPAEASRVLEHESGLLGLAGSADMREVLARVEAGDARAGLALGVYLQRLAGGVAAMAAALRGLDVLVFTGGVGERSARIRAEAAERLGFLGVAVNSTENRRGQRDREITTAEATVRTLVITAREDVEIARQVRLAAGLRT